MAWPKPGELVRLLSVHVETIGSGPRVVLVHGSVANGAMTWGKQPALAAHFTLVVVDRPGYPPNPPLERIDFEEQAEEIAELLEPGDHLVGHSYGGVISLLAAATRPALGSLTVCEPPAFGIARGNPAVEEFLARFPEAPRDPRGYLEFFLPLVGSAIELPNPLPPGLEAGARAALAERSPDEAEIPFDALRAAPFAKLVVSGAHHGAFDAVCDVLEERLVAERAVLPGAGHSIPRAPGFDALLADVLDRSRDPGPT
jgi:pimeloyl-ACP methyl ester carboxylesterase